MTPATIWCPRGDSVWSGCWCAPASRSGRRKRRRPTWSSIRWQRFGDWNRLVGDRAAHDALQHLVRLGQTEAQAVDVGEHLQQILFVVELPYQRRKLAELMQGRYQAVPRPVTTCSQGREGRGRRYRGVGGRKSGVGRT